MIRLNSDLGEGYGHWHVADETTIMPHIDMANIACGFHAGDPLTITRTLRLAKKHNVTVGAHPGYPDLQGFGRRTIPMAHDELRAMFLYQIGALAALAASEGIPLAYVKPHGALYNDMMRDETIMETLLKGLSDTYPHLPLMILATADHERYRILARSYGITLLHEFFADRAYTDEGSLVPRTHPGAVIDRPDEVLDRVQRIVNGRDVVTLGGQALPLRVDTICVHGDNPEAIALTQSIRSFLDGLR
jgi:UPF0271 protein